MKRAGKSLVKVILAIVLLIAGLTVIMQVFFPTITENEVKRHFARASPGNQIEDVYSGEGWAGVVYYHIIYTNPAGERREAVWCFEDGDEGWKPTHKEDGPAGWASDT